MPDPRETALRALMQIRSGADSPVSRLARMAADRRRATLPQDYYDPEAEAADSLDEADPEAYAMPGDPFPDRPFDPGDEGRAAAIDAYNRGPKPGADPRGFAPYPEDMAESDMPGPDLLPEEVRPDFGSNLRSAGPSGNARGYGPAYDYAQQRSNDFIPREPRNSAEAVDALGPVFAQLQNDYGSRAPLGASAVEIPGYSAAGAAPRVGGIEEELDPYEMEPDNDEDDILAMMRRR